MSIKQFGVFVIGLRLLALPDAIALQAPLRSSVSRTTSPLTSTETPTALHYRDNVQDEEGMKKGLNSQLPQRQQKEQGRTATGRQMEVFLNMAATQTVALLGVTCITALVMAISGHGSDLNSIHWNDSDSFRSLFAVSDLNGWRFFQGALAAIPMIYLSKQVETSDRRDMSHVNFSTMNMVMTLFGRRKHQHPISSGPVGSHATLQVETPMPFALLLSTAIAIATGFSEEIIFRGFIPTAIVHITHSIPIALVGQGILFGIGHQSPAATRGENNVISAMQTVSGTWYGLVYLLAGGDILPCIVAHALYDTHILMETWMKINDQMDYTETAVLRRLTKTDEKQIRKIKLEVGSSLSAETLAFLRRFFYAFDYDHAGSLSRSDVQRAISYAFLRDTEPPTEERVNQLFDRILANRDEIATGEMAGRLMLPEFLRMILFIRANPSKSID